MSSRRGRGTVSTLSPAGERFVRDARLLVERLEEIEDRADFALGAIETTLGMIDTCRRIGSPTEKMIDAFESFDRAASAWE